VSLRWSVQASPANGFKLFLTVLPASARALRGDARLNDDLTRGLELGTWVMPSDMVSSGSWKGPKPVLFAQNPELAKEESSKHEDRIFTGNTSLL